MIRHLSATSVLDGVFHRRYMAVGTPKPLLTMSDLLRTARQKPIHGGSASPVARRGQGSQVGTAPHLLPCCHQTILTHPSHQRLTARLTRRAGLGHLHADAESQDTGGITTKVVIMGLAQVDWIHNADPETVLEDQAWGATIAARKR
jgi:hypothetical protein